jgi:hypothetical protein
MSFCACRETRRAFHDKVVASAAFLLAGQGPGSSNSYVGDDAPVTPQPAIDSYFRYLA